MIQEQGLQDRVQSYRRPLDESYEGVAEVFSGQELDFALVDGRRRLACTRAVLLKIKPGGILILDNAERYIANAIMGTYSTVIGHRDHVDPAWELILGELESWRSVLTTNRIWDTRIWVKPQ